MEWVISNLPVIGIALGVAIPVMLWFLKEQGITNSYTRGYWLKRKGR